MCENIKVTEQNIADVPKVLPVLGSQPYWWVTTNIFEPWLNVDTLLWLGFYQSLLVLVQVNYIQLQCVCENF